MLLHIHKDKTDSIDYCKRIYSCKRKEELFITKIIYTHTCTHTNKKLLYNTKIIKKYGTTFSNHEWEMQLKGYGMQLFCTKSSGPVASFPAAPAAADLHASARCTYIDVEMHEDTTRTLPDS